MNRTALIALTLGLISLCPARSANADFLINGNFEAPVITNPSYSIFTTIPGWTSTTGAGIEIQNHVAGAPIEGDQFVELDSDNNSNMFQDVATVVGQSYHLSFYYSPRPGISAASNGIKVFWNGSEVTELTGVGQSTTDWTLHNFDLTATQGVTPPGVPGDRDQRLVRRLPRRRHAQRGPRALVDGPLRARRDRWPGLFVGASEAVRDRLTPPVSPRRCGAVPTTVATGPEAEPIPKRGPSRSVKDRGGPCCRSWDGRPAIGHPAPSETSYSKV